MKTTLIAVAAVIATVVSIVANLERFSVLVAKCFRFLGGFFSFLRRRTVRLELESSLRQAAHRLNAQGQKLLPDDIRVTWITGTNRESFLSGNGVVLKLSFEENKDVTFAFAVRLLVAEGLLPSCKPYVQEDVVEATELAITRAIVARERFPALRHFSERIWRPCVPRGSELEELCTKAVAIEADGLMTTVMLPELSAMGVRLGGMPPHPSHHKETRAFFDFLASIAAKKPGEIVDLQFNGFVIRTGIVLVAERGKYEKVGGRPYVKAVQHYMDHSIRSIFVIGLRPNTESAKNIARWCCNHLGLRLTEMAYSVTFPNGKATKGVCCLLEPAPIDAT